MKRRQRKIAALLLACVMTCLPVSQVFAETSYDVAAGVSAQVLFPKDSLIGIAGAVTVDDAETALTGEGTWTNTEEAKVYAASSLEDGTIEIEQVGYVLDVKKGTSSKKDDGDNRSNHYQFGDWEKPDGSLDRAYYAEGETVKLKADEPAEGMEFKGWTCEQDGVVIEDASSPETTVSMPGRKVTITAEYQEKQPETDAPGIPEENNGSEDEIIPEGDNGSGDEIIPEENNGSGEIVIPDGNTGSGDVVIPNEPQDIVIDDGGQQESVSYNVEVENGTASGIFLPGEQITVTANDRTEEGLEFSGWYVSSENVQLEDAAASVTGFVMPEGNVSLVASYQEAKQGYTLTVNHAASDQTTYMAGDQVTVTANDRSEENLEFAGWYAESGNISIEDVMAATVRFTMPEGDVVLTATYEEKQQEESQENTGEVQAPADNGSETTAAEPVTAETELTTDAPEQTEPATDAPTETEPTTSAPVQTEAPQPDTTEQTDANMSDAPIEIETTTPADAEPEPQPEAVKYAVTVENGGKGSGEFEAGATVTVEAAAPEEGKSFDSWKSDDANVIFSDPTQAVTTFTMPGNAVTVTPQYKTLRTITVDENTTVSPSAEELRAAVTGTQVMVTAKDLTANGKNFVNWTATAAKGDTAVEVSFADAAAMTTTFTLPDCDSITLSANYADAPKTYKVTVANGLINNTSTELTCEANTQITVTANPSPSGQAFAHWTINDGTYDIGDAAYSQTIQLTVTDQDLVIRADYEGIQYQITVQDGTSNYDTCVNGTAVTITADDAPEGYEFDYWTVDTGNASLADAYSETTTFAMPAGDVTISANYRETAYSLYVENGSADDDLYYADETVTIKSNYPASGRVFSKWESVSGNVTFADASRWKTSFTMPASDVEVRATYKDGPSTNDNVILDLAEGGEYYIKDTIKFTASGAGMGNSNPNPGDYRYRPSGYQIGNVTGTLQSPYSISMAINAAGEYTLKVTFNKDIFDGNNWVADGTTDTKSVTFRVVPRAAGVATGDETPIAVVAAIAVVSCAAFLILLVVFLKRRRK